MPNTIVVPSMDSVCFISNDRNIVNLAGFGMYDDERIEIVKNQQIKKLVSKHPKMRYKLKVIMGDYYYEEMSLEETIEKAFIGPASEDLKLKSQDDADDWIRDNLNQMLPLDGPLWRCYS